MPYKGEETSDLVREPQTRDAQTSSFVRFVRPTTTRCGGNAFVCIRKRKRGRSPSALLLGRLRDKKYAQGRTVGGPVRRRAAGSCGPRRASDNGTGL